MIDMARKQIIPAGFDAIKELTDVAVGKQSLSLSVEYERKIIDHLSHLVEEISHQTDVLQKQIEESRAYEDHQKKAEFYRDQAIPAMNALRQAADQLEAEVGAKYWPYPVYSDLLFRI